VIWTNLEVKTCQAQAKRSSTRAANAARAYFLAHEREDIVEDREEFVKYFPKMSIIFIQLQMILYHRGKFQNLPQ
jgi:hypothetical protein